jgi:tRNA pseudouridine38-40 synthase
MRIAACVEYNGSAYHGWQTQHVPSLDTLQTRCEQALSKVADHPITVICAGRTDKGVHALAQIIHFDTTAVRTIHAWMSGTNHYLPNDMRVLWAKPVSDAFHARHTAISRRYRYVLYNHPVRPALLRNQVSWYPVPLNLQTMREGAQCLLGEHDFSAFRGADCQAKTTLRRIDYLELTQEGDFITLDIQANAFLHHMVRNIVGVLIAIGKGEQEPAWAQKVLLSRQRSLGGVTAPPQGLYLMQVGYPEEWDIPSHNFSGALSYIPLAFQDTGFC